MNKFYVHHEGGGWCFGDVGCGHRGKGLGQGRRALGSDGVTPVGPELYTDLGSTEQYVDSGTLDGGYYSSGASVELSFALCTFRVLVGRFFRSRNQSTHA